MLNIGLNRAIQDIDPLEFKLPSGEKVKISFQDAHITYSMLPLGVVGSKSQFIYPSECRQRAATYKGKLTTTILWSLNGIPQVPLEKDMGDVPIMLKSDRCHLSHMSPKQLVEHGEHEQEWGGYFVIKGHERLIRMLLMTRRNYPVAIKRSTWKGRGNLFSEYGVMIRCVKEDQTSNVKNNT